MKRREAARVVDFRKSAARLFQLAGKRALKRHPFEEEKGIFELNYTLRRMAAKKAFEKLELKGIATEKQVVYNYLLKPIIDEKAVENIALELAKKRGKDFAFKFLGEFTKNLRELGRLMKIFTERKNKK